MDEHALFVESGFTDESMRITCGCGKFLDLGAYTYSVSQELMNDIALLHMQAVQPDLVPPERHGLPALLARFMKVW